MGEQQPTFAQPIDKKDLYALRAFVAGYLADGRCVSPTLIATLDKAIANAEAEAKEVETFDKEFPSGSLT